MTETERLLWIVEESARSLAQWLAIDEKRDLVMHSMAWGALSDLEGAIWMLDKHKSELRAGTVHDLPAKPGEDAPNGTKGSP